MRIAVAVLVTVPLLCLFIIGFVQLECWLAKLPRPSVVPRRRSQERPPPCSRKEQG